MQFVCVCAVNRSGRCDAWCQTSRQTKHGTERCVSVTDSDGIMDQEVAVLYTGELTNCLWAEKAEHWAEGGKKWAKRMM